MTGSLQVLCCVRQAVKDKILGMLVGKRVNDVLADPFAPDDVFRPEDTKPLRDHGHGVAFKLKEIPYAGRALTKGGQQAQACWIPHRAEDSGAPLKCPVGDIGSSPFAALVICVCAACRHCPTSLESQYTQLHTCASLQHLGRGLYQRNRRSDSSERLIHGKEVEAFLRVR